MTFRDTARLTFQLAKEQAGMWALARFYRDPLCQLSLPSGAADPYSTYRRLRAEGPLSRSRAGVWVTPAHRVCNEVLRDRRFGTANPHERREPAPLGHEEGTEWELSFLQLNPPDHTRLRRLAMPAFSPKKIASYRPRIEKVTHRLVDAALAHGEFDLMRDVAAPLPISVITDLLGIPDADDERFARYGKVVGRALDGVRTPMQARALRDTTRDLNELFADLVRRRATDPGDDVISSLAASLGDEQLTPRELLGICRLLLIAGFETTVNLIGNGTLALMQHPEQWARLRDDPELAPKVVEETLRYDSPVQVTGRVAGEDLELAGEQVRAGTHVVALLGAAGRDPDVYSDPDTFDIDREPEAEHLAFSGGRHYCLGAPLARLEGAVVFQVLAERLPHLVQNGPQKRRRTFTLRGLSEFPVRATSSADLTSAA